MDRQNQSKIIALAKSNGHCPRCEGWIMLSDKFGEQGCLNCGWYDYFGDGNGHRDAGDGYEKLLVAVLKPKMLNTRLEYKYDNAR